MLQVFEIIPMAVFFFAFKLYGMQTAIGALIVTTAVTTGGAKLMGKNPSGMHLASFAMLVIFGGASLWFHNDMFLKWKPSVLNFLSGFVFLGSQFIGQKTITEHIVNAADLPISVSSEHWRKLNYAWVVFFFVLGMLNLYVAYTFSTDFWVNFKVFGLFGLTLVFLVGQVIYLSRVKQD